MTPTRRQLAAVIADRCADAYSATRYRSWAACADTVLALGFDEYETEALLRSKITRWAADNAPHPYGRVPARVIREYIYGSPYGETDDGKHEAWIRREVAEWAEEYRTEEETP